SFEDSERPEHWTLLSSGPADAEMTVANDHPLGAKNPHSLKLAIRNPGRGRVGVVNNGFWGIALRKGAVYNLSLNARAEAGFRGPLTITLESTDGLVYARATVDNLGPDWKAHQFALTAGDTDPNSRLVISSTKPGTFWLDVVSVFPRETWKGR